jgi:hypothetical protein
LLDYVVNKEVFTVSPKSKSCEERSPGADVAGVSRNPGADVAGVSRNPGADVAGVSRSPGADVAGVSRSRSDLEGASAVLVQMWQA